MKILLIHNHYGDYSGETSVMQAQDSLLRERGHEVMQYTRSSAELKAMRFGKVYAFFTGLHNPASVRKIKQLISEFRPDIVHIHNLYPIISPAILPHIKKLGIPLAMTVHNYRLICPNGLFYNKRGICERCAKGKEWNCMRYNCEESVAKSFGYALRNVLARMFGYYHKNVDAFLCLTEFQKQKLVNNDFSERKCIVMPNFINLNKNISVDKNKKRKGFLFIGRLNRQKGIDVFTEAARKLSDVSFKIAGNANQSFIDVSSFSDNVEYLGVIGEEEKLKELSNAEALVFTSRSYEGFPMVFLEAMCQRVPIIAPNLAGYPEIIRHEFNGLLFNAEDISDLSRKIVAIHSDPTWSAMLGNNGFEFLKNNYTESVWYDLYVSVLKKVKKNY